MHAVTERCGKGRGEAVVPTTERERVERAERAGPLLEDACLQVIDGVGAAHLEPGAQRLSDGGVDPGPRQRLAHALARATRCLRSGGPEPGAHRLKRDGTGAAWLPVAVLRALADGVKPEPFRIPEHELVIGQDELGAAFDHAAGERPREHASADAVTRLEHIHLGARTREFVGRREPGEPGTDHDDSNRARSPSSGAQRAPSGSASCAAGARTCCTPSRRRRRARGHRMPSRR